MPDCNVLRPEHARSYPYGPRAERPGRRHGGAGPAVHHTARQFEDRRLAQEGQRPRAKQPGGDGFGRSHIVGPRHVKDLWKFGQNFYQKNSKI